MREVQKLIIAEEFESQSHFYAGNSFRRGTLRANSGSYAKIVFNPFDTFLEVKKNTTILVCNPFDTFLMYF
jgi:hypothetical protein